MIQNGLASCYDKMINFGQKIDIIDRMLNQKRIATKVMTKCFNKKWDYIVFKLEKILEKSQDKMLKFFVKLIRNIPVELKDAICYQYVKNCKFVHSIAIMEWRGITMKNSE